VQGRTSRSRKTRLALVALAAVLLVVPEIASAARAWRPGEFAYRSAGEYGGVYDVGIGDVTGDGITDVVATDPFAGLVVLPGTGGGGFGAAVTTSFGAHGPLALDLGRINGDAALDVAVFTSRRTPGGYEETVRTALGSASGAFTNVVDVPTPASGIPAFLNANGDADVDLAILSTYRVSIGHGNGTGSFSFPAGLQFTLDARDGGFAPQGKELEVADFNGGTDDLLFGTGAGGEDGFTRVVMSGAGGSYSMSSLPNVRSGMHHGVAAGAFVGGDTSDDVLTTQSSSRPTLGIIDVFAGNGAGGFTGAGNVAVDGDAYDLTVADFDNDGREDAMSVNYGVRHDFPSTGRYPSSVNWIRNTPTGLVVLPIVPDQEFVSPGFGVDSGDFTGDGFADVAAATYNGLVVYRSYDDTTPPETSVSPPAPRDAAARSRGTPVVDSRRPKMKFDANERGAAFECKLDKGRFRACRPPYRLPKLSPGRHKFQAKSIDLAQNVDTSPATQKFVVRKP
jgi:hypothetical protein